MHCSSRRLVGGVQKLAHEVMPSLQRRGAAALDGQAVYATAAHAPCRSYDKFGLTKDVIKIFIKV
jgi:hypothetical protein